MEAQHVMPCTTGVAAFVDALEMCFQPMVEGTGGAELAIVTVQGNLSHEEAYAITNAEIIETQDMIPPAKRRRINPKKQKEVIERLFEKQKAVVTEKAFMNMKGNKRFKSDVWSCFGDIKLLISRSEAKQLQIPYYLRRCGNEEMMLSKSFVGCFKCSALFIHDAQKSGTSTLRAHMRVCCRPKLKKKKGSPTIIFFRNKHSIRNEYKDFTEEQKLDVQEQILNYLLSTHSSFDTVEELEFQKLLQICITVGATYGDVNIESMLCPPDNLTDYLLNDMYVKSVNSFYTEFQYSYGATFNSNIWVEEQQKMGYVSLICHYSNSSGELKSVVIHTDEFDYESKNSEDIKEWFNALLNTLPVVPFKRLIVTDNNSNMVSAFKDEQYVKCAYQNLNFALQEVVKKALETSQNDYPDFASLLNGCKDLVSYFQDEQIMSQYQLPEPLQHCKDNNWNSILTLFRSVSSQYDEILNILNVTSDTHLLSVDKFVLLSVIELLHVFEEALGELSNGADTTLNVVIPWITKLRKRCLSLNDDFPVIQQLKSHILVEINEHLDKNISVYHRIATHLDPRFKRMVFLPRDDQIGANVKTKCLVKECMEAPVIEDFPDNQKSSNESTEKDRFSDLYSSSVSYEAGNSEKSANREVDTYLSEPFQLMNQDLDQQNKFSPLKYWANNSDRYPNLSKVAMWILSCPASCIQTEETFSANNWLVNCSRTHQRPENISKTLFVKSFKKL